MMLAMRLTAGMSSLETPFVIFLTNTKQGKGLYGCSTAIRATMRSLITVFILISLKLK